MVIVSGQDHLNLLQQVFVSPVLWICEEDILSDDALRPLEGQDLIDLNDFLYCHKIDLTVLSRAVIAICYLLVIFIWIVDDGELAFFFFFQRRCSV